MNEDFNSIWTSVTLHCNCSCWWRAIREDEQDSCETGEVWCSTEKTTKDPWCKPGIIVYNRCAIRDNITKISVLTHYGETRVRFDRNLVEQARVISPSIGDHWSAVDAFGVNIFIFLKLNKTWNIDFQVIAITDWAHHRTNVQLTACYWPSIGKHFWIIQLSIWKAEVSQTLFV